MNTITLSKSKYEVLKKQASLYDAVLRYSPGRGGVEEYSPKRIKEFLREDRIGKQARARIKRFLKQL